MFHVYSKQFFLEEPGSIQTLDKQAESMIGTLRCTVHCCVEVVVVGIIVLFVSSCVVVCFVVVYLVCVPLFLCLCVQWCAVHTNNKTRH